MSPSRKRGRRERRCARQRGATEMDEGFREMIYQEEGSLLAAVQSGKGR
jgi:hypothetical protein